MDDDATCLLQQIRREHQDIRVLSKRLRGSKIPNGLEMNLRRGHDLNDVECSPGHIIAKHV